MPRILLIDDQWGREFDPMISDRYGSIGVVWLLEPGTDAAGQGSVKVALDRVHREASDLAAVLLDINFGLGREEMGVDVLKGIRHAFPTLPVLMFTSLESAEHRELVIRCMELGANEYVEKAPSAPEMEEILAVYTESAPESALYGNSLGMRSLRARMARIALSSETSVLIVGESGTGKELVAHGLHRQGPRASGPFIAKNCAYSDFQLLDSELFGHVKGAFTGAVSQRRGLIEEADGGVLFLDEVADMPLELQGKLLRTLETRKFRRVGGTEDLGSSFQLLTASNRPAEELIAAGRLREDFYFRVATVTLRVPPLRERVDDIPILSEHFLARFRSRGGASYPGRRLSSAFIADLHHRPWPGNVRELRNVVERAAILSASDEIDASAEAPLVTVTDPPRGPTEAPRIDADLLPENAAAWPRTRLTRELQLGIAARDRIRCYKGDQWKAEFMRLMYPACKAANAKGFDDLLRRLTSGPWGDPSWNDDEELSTLVTELREGRSSGK